MKIGKILGRVILFTPMLIVALYAALRSTVKFMWLFIAYGGETIVYEKDTKVSMIDIHEQLKKMLTEINEKPAEM